MESGYIHWNYTSIPLDILIRKWTQSIFDKELIVWFYMNKIVLKCDFSIHFSFQTFLNHLMNLTNSCTLHKMPFKRFVISILSFILVVDNNTRLNRIHLRIHNKISTIHWFNINVYIVLTYIFFIFLIFSFLNINIFSLL